MNFKRLRRRTAFHLLRLMAASLSGFGIKPVQRLGASFGRWHYRLALSRRRRLVAHLAEACELPPDSDHIGPILKEAFEVNDRAILEILAMYSGRLKPARIAELCRVDGLDCLDQALEQGKGVVLLGLHMGNGVAMATHLAARGYPVAVIYRESKKIQPDFFRRGIATMGLEAIPATPASVGFRQMLRALRENRVLFILMDQGAKQGVEMPFLGKYVPMPAGPAELVRRTGAALLPARLRAVDPEWHFELGPIETIDASEPLEATIEKLTRIMEIQIRETPQWWTWHQRRWLRHEFPELTRQTDL